MKWKHIHLKYWVFWENRPFRAGLAGPFERNGWSGSLLVFQLEPYRESLTGVMLSHRIVVSRRDHHYV